MATEVLSLFLVVLLDLSVSFWLNVLTKTQRRTEQWQRK
nr:MAG TPA: hypothetical protein [Caudoviricetes sp.]